MSFFFFLISKILLFLKIQFGKKGHAKSPLLVHKVCNTKTGGLLEEQAKLHKRQVSFLDIKSVISGMNYCDRVKYLLVSIKCIKTWLSSNCVHRRTFWTPAILVDLFR